MLSIYTKICFQNHFGHTEKCSYWSIGKCSYLKSTAKCSLSLGFFQTGIILFGSKRSQNCSTVNKTLESDKRGNEVNLWIRHTQHSLLAAPTPTHLFHFPLRKNKNLFCIFLQTSSKAVVFDHVKLFLASYYFIHVKI